MADHEAKRDLPPYHVEGGAFVLEPPKDPGEVARRLREVEQHEFSRKQVEHNKQLVWLTAALCLATIFLGVWQAKISQESSRAAKSAADTAAQTLREMQSGGGAQDTHTLAEQAKTQAVQTTVLATAAGKQATETEKLAKDAIVQAKAANVLAAQAQRSADYARDGIQATVEGFHSEDRAWVGVEEAKPLSYTADGPDHSVNLTVAFTLRNYGHSAAQQVRFFSVLESDPTVYKPSCNDVAAKNHVGDVLLPTQERTLNYVMNLTSKQIHDGWTHQNPATGRTLFLRVLGCIEYSDRKGEQTPHRTPLSYMVWWRKNYITADTQSVPGGELSLEPLGTDTDQTY